MKPPILFFALLLCQSLFAQIEEVLQDGQHQIEIQFLKQVNSEYRDVNISITPNGRYLYFMSGRGGKSWTTNTFRMFKGKPDYDGDIWYSQIQDGEWQAPSSMPASINTSRGEDEPNISADAQRVYFQSWKDSWRSTGGPYYQAELYGDRWENPVGLGGGINAFFAQEMDKYNRYATDGMSISPNGKIFLVAAGPNYDGNLDIYISRKNKAGQWSFPVPLDLNTPRDERSVFIAGDNKTIYFGSSGYGGKGGLDIFKTTLNDDNSTGEIINIGAPFNTKRDDYGFIIGALGDDCFFVRDDDIYYAHLSQADAKLKPTPTIVIDGTLRDSLNRPTQGEIDLYYQGLEDPIAEARSNSITGEYSMSFPKKPGKYLLHFSPKGYKDFEESFEIEDESENLMELDTKLPKAEKKETEAPIIVEKSPEPTIEPMNAIVYFDFDKDNLTSKAISTLKELYHTLRPPEAYKLQVTGHTDAVGTNIYNMNLSERRAQRVAQFFREKGYVVEVNIAFKGEEVPAVENDTAENRAKNRRVEIRWQAK